MNTDGWTPYKITVDVQALTHGPSPRTTTFQMVFIHWAGDALTLADVMREAVMEQAMPMPSRPAAPPPPPPNEPDVIDGRIWKRKAKP